MLYTINRINRMVNLNDDLVNKYLEYDELHEQLFSIALRSKFHHAPTEDDVSDDNLSALCNDILLSELKALELLPKAISYINDNYSDYKKNSKNGELIEQQL